MSTAPILDVLTAEAARLGVGLGAQAAERFGEYLLLLEEWHGRAGLTAITERSEVQRRHFGESLALLVVLREAGVVPTNRRIRVADLGTGAGFPGIPLYIVEPALQLTLVEANAQRCRFLRVVVETLALEEVTIVQARAEEAGRVPALRKTFDLVVARALAPMAVLVEYALPLLRDGGVLAAPKGSRALSELEEARVAIASLGGTAEAPLSLPLPPEAPAQQVLVVRRTGALDTRFPRRTGIPSKRPLGG